MFTSIISFFTNIKEYLIAAIIFILIVSSAWFYVRYEQSQIQVADAATKAAQQQNQALITQNQALEAQIKALQAAQAQAQAEIAAAKQSAAQQANTINKSTYDNNSATTAITGLLRAFPGADRQ